MTNPIPSPSSHLSFSLRLPHTYPRSTELSSSPSLPFLLPCPPIPPAAGGAAAAAAGGAVPSGGHGGRWRAGEQAAGGAAPGGSHGRRPKVPRAAADVPSRLPAGVFFLGNFIGKGD
ncbi:hypothetical protein [Oryza sativa Japonica Group]|uniref:Uncharacterized protein n=2 Tax=Oryza sativa subsp. japonica TaxID=39947 RepID=Q5QLL2_ORYSJ|nr:hypothetical protein [Oryza sativa Japonica Group]BAD73705.1 hypothetical protein [Oryza sativa Japonica Group]